MTDQNYFVLNGTVKKVLDLQTKRDKITVAYPSDEEAHFKGFNVQTPPTYQHACHSPPHPAH